MDTILTRIYKIEKVAGMAFICLFSFLPFSMRGQQAVSQEQMERIYQEVRTPYKYGMVVAPGDNYHKIDCPTVFRVGNRWLMTYVVYNGKDGLDGRGYETWLASSDDLLHWQTQGRLLSYPADTARWDANQRGGFPALIDWTWGGSYEMAAYKGKHWMTYIGGHGTGYEAVREPLNIGMAWTQGDLTQANEWQTGEKPLLSIHDKDVQWWEQLVQYKSTIYEMGKEKWKRYDQNPVYFHEAPGIITGDAQIVRMDGSACRSTASATESSPLYVMFYFSAYNPARKYNAYNTFAVSRDLIHWQDWQGEDLIVPSKPYDEMFAHKSYVVKHDGVVYHFYCAVNNAQQRGIAVATSVPMGRSDVRFPAPEPTGRRTVTPLNDGWLAHCSVGRDTIATPVTLPHNFDDYYGYRHLRHGNLHGQAVYQRSFTLQPKEGKRYFLQLEGVGTYATITLNDTEYPKELIGRTVFTLDITDALNTGKNTLHILVDHPAMQTVSPWVCGGCSSEWGFSEGSQPFGIFRPVSLIETDAVRIEPFGVHIWNNAVCDSVFIETEVKNYAAEAQQIELINKFTLASGKQVFRHAQPLTLAAGETRTLRHAERIENAHRWSLDDPYLYNLVTMIKRPAASVSSGSAAGMLTTDEVRTPFGIRSIQWPIPSARAVCRDTIATSPDARRVATVPDGFPSGDHRFRLNGTPVFINGTCEYEHLLGQSHAFSPMPASTPSARLTSPITCSISSCSTSRASSSGASSRPTSGTTPPHSATTSSACWCAGLRSAATRRPSSCGACRTRACCPASLPRSAPTSSARSTPPAVTSAASPPATAARVPTGTSSRTGAVPTAVLPTTTTTS